MRDGGHAEDGGEDSGAVELCGNILAASVRRMMEMACAINAAFHAAIALTIKEPKFTCQGDFFVL